MDLLGEDFVRASSSGKVCPITLTRQRFRRNYVWIQRLETARRLSTFSARPRPCRFRLEFFQPQPSQHHRQRIKKKPTTTTTQRQIDDNNQQHLTDNTQFFRYWWTKAIGRQYTLTTFPPRQLDSHHPYHSSFYPLTTSTNTTSCTSTCNSSTNRPHQPRR